MKRQDFFKLAMTAGAAGISISALLDRGAEASEQREPGPLPRRPLGSTGDHLSIIGFGGILVMDETPEHSAELVSEAIDKGINYFDVAPTYGNAEDRLGPALEPYRKDVFLACKTAERDAAGAEKELHQSLGKLRTDYLDLYQLHAITSREDIEKAFGPGGAMETFVKAREQGKVRNLGFSAHSVEAALAAMERFDFDTTLFPLNYGCWFEGDFGHQVVKEAHSRQMGILALKAGARKRRAEDEEKKYGKCWYTPLTDRKEIARSYHFTLSLPVTACVPPGEEELWRMALDVGRRYLPVTDTERDALAQMAASLDPLFSYPAWES